MIVEVKKEEIIEGLAKASGIIPAKSGAAFLRTVWLKAEEEELVILATDSNLEFRGAYRAEVKKSGLIGVQVRSFYDLVKLLPQGTITLKADQEARILHIEQRGRKYKLPTAETAWFRDFAAYPAEAGFVWSGEFIQTMLDRLSFCISDDDTMEAIACLSMKLAPNKDKIEACAMNGHQFALNAFTHEGLSALMGETGMLMQRRYLAELKKWLAPEEVEVALAGKRLFFRSTDEKETLSLPLSYYQYPDYHNFLSKLNDPGAAKLSVKRADFIDSLNRILIFNSENNRAANFEFRGAEMLLTAQGQEVGSAQETLDVVYSGDLKRIAFPTRNLIDILGHFSSETVDMVFTGVEGPCGVTGPDDLEYLVIVMPMKIEESTYYSEETL